MQKASCGKPAKPEGIAAPSGLNYEQPARPDVVDCSKRMRIGSNRDRWANEGEQPFRSQFNSTAQVDQGSKLHAFPPCTRGRALKVSKKQPHGACRLRFTFCVSLCGPTREPESPRDLLSCSESESTTFVASPASSPASSVVALGAPAHALRAAGASPQRRNKSAA